MGKRFNKLQFYVKELRFFKINHEYNCHLVLISTLQSPTEFHLRIISPLDFLPANVMRKIFTSKSEFLHDCEHFSIRCQTSSLAIWLTGTGEYLLQLSFSIQFSYLEFYSNKLTSWDQRRAWANKMKLEKDSTGSTSTIAESFTANFPKPIDIGNEFFV